MRSQLIFYIPLALFCIISIYLGIGLTIDPKKLPNMLEGRPVPVFKLPPIKNRDDNGFSSTDLIGSVSLVNIFGSWCAACRIEHPFLMELHAGGKVTIHGINWREESPGGGSSWLKRYGDPYSLVGDDPHSKAAIAFGVTGAPETFLIDQKGVVRYKHIGPINRKIWENLLWPMIEKLQTKKGS